MSQVHVKEILRICHRINFSAVIELTLLAKRAIGLDENEATPETQVSNAAIVAIVVFIVIDTVNPKI